LKTLQFAASLVVFALGAITLLAGCSTPAPQYIISIPHVQALKTSGAKATATTPFKAEGSAANNETIGIRGNPMNSAKGTFAAYLEDAITQELTEAKIFNPSANTKISAVLLKNDISAAGIVTASGEIEARFTVMRGDKVAFNKVKRATTTWDSHFLGAIAIPNAQQNYPKLVQALLKQLYDDNEFFAALKD
jgi:hypothetical protein